MRARETVVDRLLLRRGRGVRKCGSLQVVDMFFLLALPYVPPFYTGIISWGPNSCGEKYRPGVYTRSPSYPSIHMCFVATSLKFNTFRVGNYLSWVVRHTEEHPYDWSHYSV